MSDLSSGSATWTGGKTGKYTIDEYIPMRGSITIDNYDNMLTFLHALVEVLPYTFPIPGPYSAALVFMADKLRERAKLAGPNGQKELDEKMINGLW